MFSSFTMETGTSDLTLSLENIRIVLTGTAQRRADQSAIKQIMSQFLREVFTKGVLYAFVILKCTCFIFLCCKVEC